MSPNNTSPNYFAALDAKIEELARSDTKKSPHLYASLVELRAAIALQFAKECRQHQNEAECWERFSLKPLVISTVRFLTRFVNARSSYSKVDSIEWYEDEIQPFKLLKTLGKCLAIFIIAALCMATGAVFGLGLGLLVGCWTGPGGLVTGFAGLFAGAQGGVMIASVVASGVLAGVAGTAAGVAFFKPSPLERAKEQVIHEVKCSA